MSFGHLYVFCLRYLNSVSAWDTLQSMDSALMWNQHQVIRDTHDVYFSERGISDWISNWESKRERALIILSIRYFIRLKIVYCTSYIWHFCNNGPKCFLTLNSKEKTLRLKKKSKNSSLCEHPVYFERPV